MVFVTAGAWWNHDSMSHNLKDVTKYEIFQTIKNQFNDTHSLLCFSFCGRGKTKLQGWACFK